MKVRSYFANSVEQAIQEARQELGNDAMLITSRRASAEARHLGTYEVVFGATASSQRPLPPAPVLNGDLAALQSQLEDIKRVLQLNGSRPQGFAQPEIEELYHTFVAAGLDVNIARQITEDAAAAWQSTPVAQRSLDGATTLQDLAAVCIRRRLQFSPDFIPAGQGTGRIVVFAGPPGAGKTSTLAKIAIQQCLGRRMSIRIISVDPNRVAAHERLRALAGIIGVGFTAANSIRELIEAMEEFRGKNLLLIDTPGYGTHELDSAADLAGILTRAHDRETHLVLPASLTRENLARYIRLYQEFKPDYLLFTKLDEAESYGSILSAALEANKPLSFFATGQGIPEDIEVANPGTLLTSILGRPRAQVTSAA